MFEGVRLIGLDGLILLATAAVVAVCVFGGSRRGELALPRPRPAPGGVEPAPEGDRFDAAVEPAAPAAAVASARRAAGAWSRALPELAERKRAGVVLAAGTALVFFGQRSLEEVELARSGFALWVIGLLLIVSLDRAAEAGESGREVGALPADRARVGILDAPARPRNLVVGALIVGAALIATTMRDRPVNEGHGDVVVLWLGTIALAVLAVCWPLPQPRLARVVPWITERRVELGVVAAITVAGLLPRVYALDRYPWIYSGDEGVFGRSAREAINGQLHNPFGTGWLGHPHLYFYLEAAVMRVAGDSVAGSRLLSALLGAAAVPMTYLLVRRWFGFWTGAMAAALLAGFHFHLILSRMSLNNVGDTFFVVAALYLLDGGILRGSRGQALLAGLAMGASLYAYAGSRLLPFVALVYLGYALLAPWPRSRAMLQERAGRLAPLAGFVALGALVVALPLLAHYTVHREELNVRVNQVSVFASGWLEREREFTGKGTLAVLADQFERAALLPFHTQPTGHYRTPPPFVSWPLALPVAVGMAIATLGWWRRRYLGVTVAYWGAVLGLALTEGPPQTNRYAIAAPLLCVFAAIGLEAIGRIGVRLLRWPGRLTAAAIGIAAFGIAWWNGAYYFGIDAPDPIARYSDGNTLVANTLAYNLRELGSGWTVYYAAPPRMFYHGHPNLPFIAKDAVGIDVHEPWSADEPPPELTGPTIFFFLPERREELAVVRAWFPGGVTIEHETEEGVALYTEYRVTKTE